MARQKLRHPQRRAHRLPPRRRFATRPDLLNWEPPPTAGFQRADAPLPPLPPPADADARRRARRRRVALLYEISLDAQHAVAVDHSSVRYLPNLSTDQLDRHRLERVDTPFVLAAHHEPYRSFGPSGAIFSRPPSIAFRSQHAPTLPFHEPNTELLTIAVGTPAAPHNHLRMYHVHMHAHSAPLALVSLVRAQYASLHFVRNTNSIHIWYHPPPQPTLAEHALAAATLRLARWLVHARAGARVAPVAPSFSKRWVFDTVRRTALDQDRHSYAPFLPRVRETTALNVSLRPYQQRAVAWMLCRELTPPASNRFLVWSFAEQRCHDPFFCTAAQRQQLSVEPFVLLDLFEGAICVGHHNDPRPPPPHTPTPTGGLLCDEMGLGKTVELMQLVLCNKRNASEIKVNKRLAFKPDSPCSYCQEPCSAPSANKPRLPQCVDCGRSAHRACVTHGHKAPGGFICPSCIHHMYSICKHDVQRHQIPNSRATLIVIPSALLLQWKTEIEKHVKHALNIIVFQGLRTSGYIPQRVLQNADVVLTTYDALRADVNFVNSIRKPRTSRRYERKYFPLPVPLLGVHWHRIALDESQMLGSGRNSFSLVAEMASLLRTTHKWCVTGTPMSTDLHDVVPMFRLLRLEDAEEHMDWAALLTPSVYEQDQNRVSRILRNVMWRTKHYDVQLTELNIPRRNFEVVHTLLGPVEKYHYNMLQQHVQQVVLAHRTGPTSNNLLHMLRQACCHPRIGASGRALVTGANGGKRLRETSVQKAEKRAESPLELGEVLESLLMKCQVECEEEFRNLVASMNGQAGMSLLIFSTRAARNRNAHHLVTAVELYRNVLRLAEYNNALLKMDDIQVIHVKFNLNDALQSVKNFRQDLRRLNSPSATDLAALNVLNEVGDSIQDANLLKDVSNLKETYISEAQINLQVATATYNAKFSKLGATPLIPDDASHAPDGEETLDGHDSDAIATNEDEEPQKKQRPMKIQWWEVALAILLEEEKDEAFVDKMVQRLTDSLAGEATEIRTLATRLNSIHSLARIIPEGLKDIQMARLTFRKKLLDLPGSREPTEGDIAESGLCATCREQGTGAMCSHCRAENLITEVERKVYSLRERFGEDEIEFISDGMEKETTTAEAIDAEAIVKGTFRSRTSMSRFQSNSSRIFYQGELEVILLALASVVRKKKDPHLTEEVNEWFARLGLLKEEHNDAKLMFEAQRSLLARLDEIKMAQMRMSVLDSQIDPSQLTELELRHRIPRHRLDHMLEEFKSDKHVAEMTFQNTRGRLVYLRSLKRGLEANASGRQRSEDIENFEACPICLGSPDSFSSLAVLPCGHLFCCDCALGMITNKNLRSRANSIRCPQCRTRCLVDEINFTSTSQEPVRKRRRVEPESVGQEEDVEILSLQKPKRDDAFSAAGKEAKVDNGQAEKPSSFYNTEIEVLGQFGAKATALVRLLRSIWNQNDEEKILIFSEWSEVLNLVRLALERNNIPFCDGDQSKSSMSFARTVDVFKNSEIRNVILLPLRRAGAGLNLTEARHVVLVEPSLQVALEAQAVGRVHRIGQTKETYVHRVIVRNTIEEMILQLGNKYREDRNTSEEAVVDLKDIFQHFESLPLSIGLRGKTNAGRPVLRFVD